MRFAEFISRQLDKRRGLQTKLADRLKVSKSTITAWRNGAKPDFEICLLLAEHFQLDPMDIFHMLGDPSYKAIYRRFFAPGTSLAKSKLDGSPKAGITEESLYPDGSHAELHRDLQALLVAATPEAEAIATMIEMAARDLKIRQRTLPGRPVGDRVASFYRRVWGEGAEEESPEQESNTLPGLRERPQEG